MNPRAACRLATLGFDQVYDYVPGKVDGLARSLPREGENAKERRTVDGARDDVVTVRMDERMGDVRARVEASPYGSAFVLSERGAVLGRLRKAALEAHPDARAEDVMHPGPSTVRAHMPLDTLRNRLEKRNLTTTVVATPEGVLLRVVRRADRGT